MYAALMLNFIRGALYRVRSVDRRPFEMKIKVCHTFLPSASTTLQFLHNMGIALSHWVGNANWVAEDSVEKVFI